MTKAALNQLTKNLACEWAAAGIRCVNALATRTGGLTRSERYDLGLGCGNEMWYRMGHTPDLEAGHRPP